MTAERRDYDISREALGLPTDGDRHSEMRKVTPVTKGKKATGAKRSTSRLFEAFVEAVRISAQRSFTEKVVPEFKNMIYDGITEVTERVIYGESRSDRRRDTSKRDYAGYSRRRTETRTSYNRPTKRVSPSMRRFENVIVETRWEAEQVIDRMYELIDDYKMVTVAEFYSLVGISAEYTDERWGWTDIRSTTIQHVREGFRINLPAPKEL